MKTRNIREVKVGDVMTNSMGDKFKVEQLLDNCFAFMVMREEGEIYPTPLLQWITYQKAEQLCWSWELLPNIYEAGFDTTPKKVGVDDSEEVELDEVDIRNAMTALKEYRATNPRCNKWALDNTVWKLNKMLKERESGEGDGLDKSLNF